MAPMNHPCRFAVLCALLALALPLSAKTPAQLSPVGPDRSEHGEAAVGGLRVYSGRPATARGADAEPAYENTAFEIRTHEGKLIETAQNHYGERKGDLPALVKLAPGSYQIIAYSAQQGLVAVPVTIAAGRTTTVRFDKRS